MPRRGCARFLRRKPIGDGPRRAAHAVWHSPPRVGGIIAPVLSGRRGRRDARVGGLFACRRGRQCEAAFSSSVASHSVTSVIMVMWCSSSPRVWHRQGRAAPATPEGCTIRSPATSARVGGDCLLAAHRGAICSVSPAVARERGRPGYSRVGCAKHGREDSSRSRQRQGIVDRRELVRRWSHRIVLAYRRASSRLRRTSGVIGSSVSRFCAMSLHASSLSSLSGAWRMASLPRGHRALTPRPGSPGSSGSRPR